MPTPDAPASRAAAAFTPTRRGFLISAAAAGALSAAELDLLTKGWNARWIFPPGVSPQGYGVYLFRREFNLDAVPAHLMINVTADSRYELFVNGEKVSMGPARGDLYHWRYETVDLSPKLAAGKNTLCAVVWNDGPHAAISQWSERTALLVQAQDSAHEKLVNTGGGWRVKLDEAYEPIPVPTYQETGYYAIGPCERFNAARHPWGWMDKQFNAASWPEAEIYRTGAPRDAVDAHTRWMLVPRPIPPMEETPVRLARLRSVEGLSSVTVGFPARKARVQVPPNSKAVLLLDHGSLTTAYPVLEFNAGRGTRVSIDYTEGLYQTMKPRRIKGNRDEVEGKQFIGYGDTVVLDGHARRWRPLYWRTFRYIRLTIETSAEPAAIEDISAIYTGYPFEVKARFESGDPLHQKILETGWRTARLCAHESYMDCPYYEQLQYAGDTRIQALVSVYMTGDTRLMRNAIEQLDSSRTSEGLTYSRAPSVLQQYIPPFSLWWIGMVHDYYMYATDPEFVRSMLVGVRSVLGFYDRYLNADATLRAMPWWNYVDWVEAWRRGQPPAEANIMPATIHLQLLLACQWAVELETALGDRGIAAKALATAARLKEAIQRSFWSPERRLYSEDLAHREFSQHANALAVLAGMLGSQEAEKELIARVEADKSLYPCSVYFRYYLDRAMVRAGLGDRYLSRMATWENMLKEGLTTWAEQDVPYSRSDCHAWGSSPNVELFRTVLGIDSAAPGFSKVVVKPHMGALQRVSGRIPHPKGFIEVEAVKRDGRVSVHVKAPPGVEVLTA